MYQGGRRAWDLALCQKPQPFMDAAIGAKTTAETPVESQNCSRWNSPALQR